MQWPITLFLSFFYSGFISGGGTLASILSLPVAAQLFLLLPQAQPERTLAYGGSIALLVGLGTFAIRSCRKVPRNDCDQSFIVIDEIAGMMVALFPVMMATEFSWKLAIATFLLFRFFDIRKPLGIRKIDRMHTPLSVVMDDVIAGLYTASLLMLLSTT